MDRGRDDALVEEGGLIRIELRLDGSMPAGVATGPDGGRRDFTGWVGLISAVDALAGTDGSQTIDDGEP